MAESLMGGAAYRDAQVERGGPGGAGSIWECPIWLPLCLWELGLRWLDWPAWEVVPRMVAP